MPRCAIGVGLCALAAAAIWQATPSRALGREPSAGRGAGAETEERRVATPFRVIGHRGAAGHAPENTLEAIEVARTLGVEEVELDLQLSRDGEPVCFHDATLDEKTTGEGRVRDHTAEALRALEIGSWFDRAHPGAARRFAGSRLATLEEVFRGQGAGPFYHLELKSNERELGPRVLERVDAHGLRDRVMLTSFHLRRLEEMRALEPTLPLGWLVGRGSSRRSPRRSAEGAIERAAEARFDLVAFAAEELTSGLVRAAHARGLEIRAWGVRSKADIRHVLDVGADGMTVDWPDVLLDELRRRARAARAAAP